MTYSQWVRYRGRRLRSLAEAPKTPLSHWIRLALWMVITEIKDWYHNVSGIEASAMAAEPTFEEVKQQIRKSADAYRKKHGNTSNTVAAMLSGISLTANFLAKLDGSKTVTAATVLRAVSEVAEGMGMGVERLTDN